MKPTYKVRGVLRIYERLRTSANGNPRYCVQIGKYLYRTRPDSDFAYSVPNLDGKFVEVTVNEYHGWPSILYGGLATSLGNGSVEDGTPMAQVTDPSYDLQELPHPTAGRKAPPVPDESIGCPEVTNRKERILADQKEKEDAVCVTPNDRRLWVQAVQNGETELGLRDWVELQWYNEEEE